MTDDEASRPLTPPHRTVVEAASWKLATDLVRRHPELSVFRYHPAGGQYDCLAIRSDNGLHIDLNREGRIHVHTLDGGSGTSNWEPAEWTMYLASDPREFVAEVEQAVRLPRVDSLPATTPKTLTYRLLASVARLHMLAAPVDITMSTIDTSGYGGGPADWLTDYPVLARMIEAGDADPFALWRAKAQDIDFAIAVSGATLHRTDGSRVDLMPKYDRTGRNFTRFLGEVLAEHS